MTILEGGKLDFFPPNFPVPLSALAHGPARFADREHSLMIHFSSRS